MITARATGADGERIIVLGITRENVDRLTSGQGIRIAAATHPGFPEDLSIMIVFGEQERDLVRQLKPLIGDDTKIVGVPKTPGRPS